MSKAPLPAFHDLAMGATVIDRDKVAYRVVGKRWSPLSSFAGAAVRLLVSFRRVSDGVTREIGEAAYADAVETYMPPKNVRTRKEETHGG